MDNKESLEGKFDQERVVDRKSRGGSKFQTLSEINKEIKLRAMINVDLF